MKNNALKLRDTGIFVQRNNCLGGPMVTSEECLCIRTLRCAVYQYSITKPKPKHKPIDLLFI